MSVMTDHRGYTIGPTLAPDERPWPWQWESNVDEDCPHEWELVLLASAVPHEKGRPHIEEVVRCTYCHVPRCGNSTDDDPCDLRRHHRGDHVLWSAINVPSPPFEEDPVAIRFGFTHWQKTQAERRQA